MFLFLSFSIVKIWIKNWNFDTVCIIRKHIQRYQNRFDTLMYSLVILEIKIKRRKINHCEIIFLNQWNSRTICSNAQSFKWDQSSYSMVNLFLRFKKKKNSSQSVMKDPVSKEFVPGRIGTDISCISSYSIVF